MFCLLWDMGQVCWSIILHYKNLTWEQRFHAAVFCVVVHAFSLKDNNERDSLLDMAWLDNMYREVSFYDDVIKWKHFPRNWPFVRGIHRSPVNSPHNGQWRGALMFSLICVWINDWVNNREAGDLRRYRAHYDVIVMSNFTRGVTLYIIFQCSETYLEGKFKQSFHEDLVSKEMYDNASQHSHHHYRSDRHRRCYITKSCWSKSAIYDTGALCNT